MKDLYLDIDVVRDTSGELRANVDFSRYVGHVAAELSRKIDAAILDSVEPQLNSLGWMKERTCHIETRVIDDIEEDFCTACGNELACYYQPHYCPNCGAKVVKE